MLIDSLKVNNVRNINNTHIQPSAFLNVIVGANASGKTALLEAIHILARARSFRTPRINEVIQHDKESLQIVARIKNAQSSNISTGIEKSTNSTVIRYNGKTVKTVSKQANNIPLVLITPDSQTLITGSPKQRRYWLDWAMFHVEPNYLDSWIAYQKALRNRNILLKTGASKQQTRSWESSMAGTAVVLNKLRKNFIEKLQAQVVAITGEDFPGPLQIILKDGCPDSVLLTEYLEKDREKDRRLGYTKYGPHKGDIRFLTGRRSLAEVCSRGQIKRFVTLLLMAQGKTYESIKDEKPIFLIDDYGAELDDLAKTELLSLLIGCEGQVFLTSTEEDKALLNISEKNLFHVEHGCFNKVVK